MSKGLLSVLPLPPENKKGCPSLAEIPEAVYKFKKDWHKNSIVTSCYK